MDWQKKQALSNCRVFILENVHDVIDLLDDFLEAGLVNSDDAEEITVQVTKLRRKQAFMNQLLTWGPQTFNVLLKSLKRTSHDHVCDKLEEELNFVKQTKAVGNRRDIAPPWLTHHIGCMLVSERVLHLLAQEIPPSVFYTLGSCLGLTNGRLQHFVANHTHTPSLQLSTMLCDWRATHSSQATIEVLVTALRQSKVEEDVYRDILLDDLGVFNGQNQELIHRMDSICTSPSGNAEQWV